MHIGVAIRHSQVLAKRVDSIADLLRRTGIARCRVGILDCGQHVVGIDIAAAGDRDAIDILGSFIGPRGHVSLNGQIVVVAIKCELGGLVCVVGGSAVGVILNGFGDSPQIVIEILRHDPSGIRQCVHPAG